MYQIRLISRSQNKDNDWVRYGCRTFQKDFEEENFPEIGKPIHFRGHFNHKWWVVQKMQIEFSDLNGIGRVQKFTGHSILSGAFLDSE